MELTSRERILRTHLRQEVDRMPMVDKPWAGTLRRWEREGMPKGADWIDHFGYDRIVRICPDNSPRFPVRVLEENERSKVVTTAWGGTQRVFKELDATNENLSFRCPTADAWPEVKARMLEYHEDRIPWDYLKKNYPLWKARGDFLQLTVWFGFDVAHSRLVGTENFLVAMYDDPEWVTDMFETYLTTSLDLCQRILDAGYEFDGIFWYDDMGYKGTSFFSPDLYRELLLPYHKRAVDWAHERGMVAELHSCGYIEKLLPAVMETGVEMLNPIEIKAGMDPLFLKKTYGDRLSFHGGINAQLWDDFERVAAEMERVIPILKEGGGYLFASDHSIPNSVSYENMKLITALAKKLGRY
ncbi:MAG: hypothetical protein IKM48_06715 [Clostridia bacterium]|nr:hypothetical protein [Clostridia bacterium]